MSAQPILPPASELAKMLKRPGVTRQSIADEYGVSRAAVSKKLLRADKGPGQVRHNTLLPWRLNPNDLLDYDARMLRAEGRHRLGMKLNVQDAARLPAWREGLRRAGVVIVYIPEHRARRCKECKGQGGFHHVPRADAVAKWGEPHEAFDTELIFVTQKQGNEILRRSSRSA